MLYVVLVLAATFFWSISNLIDKYMIEKYCEDDNPGALVLFSALAGAPVVAVIAIFNGGIFQLPFIDILILISSGIIYILGTVFYLYALQKENSTVVIAQGGLIPVWGFLLGTMLLQEYLGIYQIIPGIIIILSSIALNLVSSEFSESKWNTNSFVFMLIASFFFALADVLFKYISIDVDFWVSILWIHIGFIIVAIILYLYKPYRVSFNNMLFDNSVSISIVNALSEGIILIGNLLFHYALLIGTLAIVQVLSEGIQPFFVLLLGLAAQKYLNLKEKLYSKREYSAQITLMLIILACILLINTQTGA